MKKVCISIIVVLGMWALTCSLVKPNSAQAAGFGLYEWSARGNSMGGALVATQNPDASTVAFNPAAMTMIDETETLLGASFISPSVTVAIDGVDTVTEDQTFIVPHAYYVNQIGERVWFGFGTYTRFGLGNEYDRDWQGNDRLYKVDFQSSSISPTLAFKVTDDLSVGLGAELFLAAIEIRRFLTSATLGGISSDMEMKTWGQAIGANLSAHYTFNDEWALGFMYRSGMRLHGDGNVNLEGPLASHPAVRWDSGDMSMDANVPGSWTLGLSYTPFEELAMELDVVRTDWSSYKTFGFSFNPETNLPDSIQEKMYKDVYRVQFGVEYSPLDWMTVRGGYIFDQSPIRDGYEDYMLPSNDRQLFSTGLGFAYGDWTLDTSYTYIVAKERNNMSHLTNLGGPLGLGGGGSDVDFKDGTVHIFGASVGYKF